MSATSGSPSKLHCCILASKCEVTNVNGLLGCEAKEVNERLGSYALKTIVFLKMSQPIIMLSS
ncbi:MAG: hypothetical protein ACK521_06975, partial [bacterium]